MSTSIVLSIKPRYCYMILSGEKHFEYRKRGFSNTISRAFLYETSPTQMVVGEVNVVNVIKGNPMEIWNLTKCFSGINFNEYMTYYKNSTTAYALELSNPIRYFETKYLSEFGLKCAPQSFAYYVGISDSCRDESEESAGSF